MGGRKSSLVPFMPAGSFDGLPGSVSPRSTNRCNGSFALHRQSIGFPSGRPRPAGANIRATNSRETPMTTQVTEGRLHALDALRAGALLLGVLGHATISFFPDPSWVADDRDTSAVLLVAFFVAHIFRMSLFFVIAGFFAHLLLQK